MNLLKKWLFYPFARKYVHMPGRSFRGPLPPLSDSESRIKVATQKHVEVLAAQIGERYFTKQLEQASSYINEIFQGLALKPEPHEFSAQGKAMQNIIVELPGKDRLPPISTRDKSESVGNEIIIIGAHYDTVPGSPGADDNASGVAALLELGRLLSSVRMSRTVRLVAFANEEHVDSPMECMGSYAYAQRCRQRNENVVAMFSLEMLGAYSDNEGSQHYPQPLGLFYPTTANFIGFIGSDKSAALVRDSIAVFRKHVQFPSEGAAVPDSMQDASRSDQWGFWQFGYSGLMVTDTANFRYDHYHTPEDTPDKVNFDHLARVISGLGHTIFHLADR